MPDVDPSLLELFHNVTVVNGGRSALFRLQQGNESLTHDSVSRNVARDGLEDLGFATTALFARVKERPSNKENIVREKRDRTGLA